MRSCVILRAEQHTISTVSGPLQNPPPKAHSPVDPTIPSQTPSSAMHSPKTPSSVVLAWIHLVVLDSGHDPAQGVSLIHSSCSTRYLETFTGRSRVNPSLMIQPVAAVSDRITLAVASSTMVSLLCHLLHSISVAEACRAAPCNHSAMAEAEGGGSLRVGRALTSMA